MNFKKESIDNMKLEGYIDIGKITISKKREQVSYDTETTYDSSSQRTVAVSPLIRTSSPCDKCHRKSYQLYSVPVGFAIHYFCGSCYLNEKKERKNKL